eukprot:TRINITY_DN5123_c0_g1_i1.p1 TRINITY_DN5123_c0_g1~~TRINITY_DN5123_c0_g1_i1.p1  ORF type:complete len:266 (-),score=69.74 TRINITY_DN5123_c0_g1_i1:116-859(-)
MKVAACVLFVVLTFTNAEILMEYAFSLGPNQSYDEYTSAQPLSAMLTSDNLKWVRFHTPLVSGRPRMTTQHIAHLVFKDIESFALFEQEHYKNQESLFTQFWVKSRRTIYQILDSPEYPTNKRSEENPGGFMWELQYSVKEGQEASMAAYLKRSSGTFISELRTNKGFIQRRYASDEFLQSEFTFLETFEFADLDSLVKAMRGNAYQTLFKGLRPFLKRHAVTILAPGHGDGLFWAANGHDSADDDD